MLKRFLNLWRAIRFFRYFVIADSNDNSITLSRKLYKHIELTSHCDEQAKVFMFNVRAWSTFGFAINPELTEETQLADIQYNEKYKTIGFEALCPTVSKILYEYGMPWELKVRLTVSIHHLANGKVFYNIERPRP